MAVARETAAQQQGWRGARMNLSPSRSWGTCCTSGGLVHRCVHAHWQQAWCPQCRRSGLYPSAAAVIVPVSSPIAHLRPVPVCMCAGSDKAQQAPSAADRQPGGARGWLQGCCWPGRGCVSCSCKAGLHVAHSSAGLSTNLVYPFLLCAGASKGAGGKPLPNHRAAARLLHQHRIHSLHAGGGLPGTAR